MYRLNSIINLNYCWNRHICMSLVYIPTMIHKCMKKCSHTFSLLIPPFKTSVYVWKKSYTRLVHQTQVKQWQGSRSDLTISGLVRLFLFITIVKFSTIYYNKLNSEKKTSYMPCFMRINPGATVTPAGQQCFIWTQQRGQRAKYHGWLHIYTLPWLREREHLQYSTGMTLL